MDKNNVPVNCSEILLKLFEKYKNEPWVLDCSQIENKIGSWFPGIWGAFKESRRYKKTKHRYGLKSGITLGGDDGYHESIYFIIDKRIRSYSISELTKWNGLEDRNYRTLREIQKIFFIDDSNTIKVWWWHKTFRESNMKLSSPEIMFLKEFMKNISDEAVKYLENASKAEEVRIEELKSDVKSILNELDKDGNGVIDVVEGGDDFMKLFRKHQTVIKEFDNNYINYLVKISNYLKTKRNNIQQIFLEIRKTEHQRKLDENVGLLKNQIHTYELMLFHSLHMINSIVKDDLITVNEIYEEFDKLKIFKSDHEKEISQKLTDIGEGLGDLMHSISSMERNIVGGLNKLSYVTQQGFSDLNSSLTSELQSIGSSIETNNLLNAIQTYQLYKINKQTKGFID